MNFSELCKFTDMQWKATELADSHRYFLYGGRRGVLKSYWLRWYGLRRLLKWAGCGIRNVRIMLACEDFPTLTDRQISKVRTEFPLWLGEVRTSKIDGFAFHLKPQYGGGRMCFPFLYFPYKYLCS